MGFCIDHSDGSEEVVRTITRALTRHSDRGGSKASGSRSSTPLSMSSLVAHLCLVSDVLHNSTASVKNAASYRRLFEARLADIFAAIGLIYRQCASRLTAATLKEKVLRVLETWGRWSLFPPLFLMGLEASFATDLEGSGKLGGEGLGTSSSTAAPAALGAASTTVPSSTDAARDALLVQLGSIGEEDLDVGDLRRKCRLAGVVDGGTGKAMMLRLHAVNAFVKARQPQEEYDPLSASSVAAAGRGEASDDDVDGVPLDDDDDGEEDDDIDGVPLDDDDDDDDDDGSDIDGVPLE
tara:strand:- start:517 stop:1401 length:885 start_codon:yes stop_codon:yes gene_type:complete